MHHRVILPVLIAGLLAACSGNRSDDVTYHGDIAPILLRSCTPCHRPGSAGPFNLLTYEDAVRHAGTIALTVKSGFMPPWPADPSYVHFKDEKVLTNEEIGLITRWVENGTPEGDRAGADASPTESVVTSPGKPDLTVTLRRPFNIPGDNTDRFMMMKVPVELLKDTFVRLIEIVPGNSKLVHHINGHLVQYAPGKKKSLLGGTDAVDAEKTDKADAYRLLDLSNDDGSYPMLTPSVTNYLPGVEPVFYPEGIGGYRLSRQSLLLLDNIHYGPSPVDTSDLTSFNFYFMPNPPVRPTREFILGTSGISPIVPPLVIPPGERKLFTTRYTLPEDISLLTVNPHMHLLGASFKAYALTAGGDTVRLISIPKWDFRWQYFYTYPKPVHLPAGTVLIAEGLYDNTVNNPLNPFHPPRTISEREGSMRTTDEMFQLICTYLPYREGDEEIRLDRTLKHDD
ncbi:MAG: hypothetical protein RL213_1101 [Bacteroidota bacterium]|jgi:hypothetical protein